MPPSDNALYGVAEIRAVERHAIEQLNIPGFELMRRAAGAAFEQLRLRWPDETSLQICCGAGNNAGDGYLLATLAMQAGMQVRTCSVIDPQQLKGDALSAYQHYLAAGGSCSAFDETAAPQGVVVDALLGTGLSRPVEPPFSTAIDWINASGRPVLALDIPSGLHADTGCALGCAVRADLTVSFIALKGGLVTGEAADYCREIVCADLGLPPGVLEPYRPKARLLRQPPFPPRPRSAHKGRFGHVLLIGGNLGFSGAIRLAGEAALRCGAGLVSIASRPEHSGFLNIGRPELMCHAVENQTQLQPWLEKADVIAVGPGLGQDVWAHGLLAAALATDRRCVLDADALNLLAQFPVARGNWILTPHPGEAARLLACSSRDVSADRYAAVRALHKRYGGICVLKGAGSLVADADTIYVNTTGNPGMAGGGMGDVLTGIIAALLAQGLPDSDATRLAVHLHGAAADRAALQHGERGMLASDLFPFLTALSNSC